MTAYLVSFDLRKPEQNYKKLYDALNDLVPSVKILTTTYIVTYNKTAKDLYNYLRPYIDEDDCLFLCDVKNNYYWGLSSDISKKAEKIINSN